MVNLRSKSVKHAIDNEKRKKSIKENKKVKLNQSLIIKQALSNSNLSNSSSKKIVFDDEDDSSNRKPSNGKEKTVLFDGSSSEDENFEIKEKSQFSGRKGFELLNLQSTYGNDERFKIDERFLENEKDGLEQGEGNHVSDGEKVNQLKILESVLGEPVTIPESEKKRKKRTYEMVRYDASNKDHEKYVIKSEPETKEPFKKRRKEGKSQKAVTDSVPKPKVSKEKFYEVSSDIKSSFKEKKDDGGGGSFSILQTYSQNDTSAAQSDNDDEEEEEVEDVSEQIERSPEKFPVCEKQKKMQDDNDGVKKQQAESNVTVAKGIWKESFFFASDDPRFNEGCEFINKKDSKEAFEAAENYNERRMKIREILRLHVKKMQKKQDPFRHKVGGMNKKQLAGLKSKNNKTNFIKRKPPKMNSYGKI